MSILAQDPRPDLSSDAPPVPDDAHGLFGMPWAEICALRDRMARTYYWKFRHKIPLEEFVSAGNLAIAIARRDFPQASSGATFRAYLGRTILHRFFEYWHDEKKKVQKGTFTGFSLERLPSHVPYERRHDAMRLLRYLPTITTPRNRAMLLAWLSGDTDAAIGQRFGLDQTNVSRALRALLQDLQIWAWQGAGNPPPIQRRVTVLSQKDRHTIQRLAQEGVAIGVLKRRYGCDRSGITRVLHQAAGEAV
jgi:DNA-directed RNA polymerase specialized sigma24 family protein